MGSEAASAHEVEQQEATHCSKSREDARADSPGRLVPFTLTLPTASHLHCSALSPTIRHEVPHSRMPVTVIPWINVFWVRKNSTISGIVAHVAAAISQVQFVV